ncbi:MAG: hypothetical protein IPG96_00460 [Proteobacteria bacterium]|nr:hypothetical protein [Pseudomonadota bacterium]
MTTTDGVGPDRPGLARLVDRLARRLSARAAGRGVVFALLLLVLGVPLALGGAHRPTMAAAALVAAVAAVLLVIYKRHSGVGIQVGRFGALLLALGGYTALQLVPLPLPLLDWLAPPTAELLRVSLAGAGPVPR